MKGNNQVIDVNKFFSAVIRQKKDELRPFFADDAVIRWHCTNEKFTPDEYVRSNCEYPGNWEGKIEKTLIADKTAVVVGVIYGDNGASLHCISIIECNGEKIISLDEYFADDGQAPDWRLGMNIGEKIK